MASEGGKLKFDPIITIFLEIFFHSKTRIRILMWVLVGGGVCTLSSSKNVFFLF